MSVYVDPMRRCLRSARWPWSSACHLYADTTAELHDLAEAVGLAPFAFQNAQDFPHYDLTLSKRREALAHGAVEVAIRHPVRFRRRLRVKRLARESRESNE